MMKFELTGTDWLLIALTMGYDALLWLEDGSILRRIVQKKQINICIFNLNFCELKLHSAG